MMLHWLPVAAVVLLHQHQVCCAYNFAKKFPTVGDARDFVSKNCEGCNIPELDPGRYIDTGIDVRDPGEVWDAFTEPLKCLANLVKVGMDSVFGTENCCHLDCSAQREDFLKDFCIECQRLRCAGGECCPLVGVAGSFLYPTAAAAMLARAQAVGSVPRRLPEALKDSIRCLFDDQNAANIALDNTYVYWGVPPLDNSEVVFAPIEDFFNAVGEVVLPGWPYSVRLPGWLMETGSGAQAFGFNIFIQSPDLFSRPDFLDTDLYVNNKECANAAVGGGRDNDKYYAMETLKHEVVHVYQYVKAGQNLAEFGRRYFDAYCEAGNYEDNKYEVEARAIECEDSCFLASRSSVGCLRNGFDGSNYVLSYFVNEENNLFYYAERIPESECGDGSDTDHTWIMASAEENSAASGDYYFYYLKPRDQSHAFLQQGLNTNSLNSMVGWIPDQGQLDHLRWEVIPYQEGKDGKFCLLNRATRTFLGVDHTTVSESGSYVYFRETPIDENDITANCQGWESWKFTGFDGGPGPVIRGSCPGGSFCLSSPVYYAAGASDLPTGPENAKAFTANSNQWLGLLPPLQECVWSPWSEPTPCCDGVQIRARSAISGPCVQKDSIDLIPCADSNCPVDAESQPEEESTPNASPEQPTTTTPLDAESQPEEESTPNASLEQPTTTMPRSSVGRRGKTFYVYVYGCVLLLGAAI